MAGRKGWVRREEGARDGEVRGGEGGFEALTLRFLSVARTSKKGCAIHYPLLSLSSSGSVVSAMWALPFRSFSGSRDVGREQICRSLGIDPPCWKVEAIVLITARPSVT
jgi:hypothetical protein